MNKYWNVKTLFVIVVVIIVLIIALIIRSCGAN